MNFTAFCLPQGPNGITVMCSQNSLNLCVTISTFDSPQLESTPHLFILDSILTIGYRFIYPLSINTLQSL